MCNVQPQIGDVMDPFVRNVLIRGENVSIEALFFSFILFFAKFHEFIIAFFFVRIPANGHNVVDTNKTREQGM